MTTLLRSRIGVARADMAARAPQMLSHLVLGLSLGLGVFGAAQANAQEGEPAQPRPEMRALVATDAAITPSETIVLESADFRAVLSASGGGLAHYELKEDRFINEDGRGIELVTTDKPAYLPFRTVIEGLKLPADAEWRAEQLTPRSARFTVEAGGLKLVRKLEVGDGPYQLWSTLQVENLGKDSRDLSVSVEGHAYIRREDEKGGFLAGRSPLTTSGLCVEDGTPTRFEREDVVDDKPKVEGDVNFGSVDTVYFAQAFAAHGGFFKSCKLSGSDRGGTPDSPDGSLLTVSLTYPSQTLAAGEKATFRTLAFIGPKIPDLLSKAGHELRRASYVGGLPGVDSIANGLLSLLSFIHEKFVPNWGVAIILLTLFVKLVLYPLTAKSFASIAAMRQIKPEIDALNEKFKDDREKKGAAMMELYRKHKINPFGGCLPQLLQLPIWWALYTSLSTNVELFRRPFFGFWQDLTAPDPFYVLPLSLGLLMWVQQKITPSTMDAAQAKMMLYLMPIMITSFMLFLPAGLCLYMFTNSVLSIAQQKFIEYRIANNQPPTGGGVSGLSGSPSDASGSAASPQRSGRGRA